MGTETLRMLIFVAIVVYFTIKAQEDSRSTPKIVDDVIAFSKTPASGIQTDETTVSSRQKSRSQTEKDRRGATSSIEPSSKPETDHRGDTSSIEPRSKPETDHRGNTSSIEPRSKPETDHRGNTSSIEPRSKPETDHRRNTSSIEPNSRQVTTHLSDTSSAKPKQRSESEGGGVTAASEEPKLQTDDQVGQFFTKPVSGIQNDDVVAASVKMPILMKQTDDHGQSALQIRGYGQKTMTTSQNLLQSRVQGRKVVITRQHHFAKFQYSQAKLRRQSSLQEPPGKQTAKPLSGNKTLSIDPQQPSPCGDRGQCTCVLTTADCSGQGLVRVPYIPRLPSHIRVLRFSSNSGGHQCQFAPSFGKSFFENASSIEELDLSFNNLTYLQVGSFDLMPNLSSLSIVYSTGLTHGTLKHALFLSSMRFLAASGCHLGPTLPGVRDGIHESKVQTLVLQDSDFVGTFNMAEIAPLVHLTQLDLVDNAIRIVEPDMFSFLHKMDLSSNLIYKFPRSCRGHQSLFPRLEILHLRENKVEKLTAEDMVCLPKLTYLNLETNPLSELGTNAFSSARFPRLTELLLGTQLRYASIKMHAFQNSALEYLSLSGSSYFFGQEAVHPDAFGNCPNLTELQLNGNDFRNVDEERFLRLFGKLRSLEILFLSNCYISQISPKTFREFVHLSVLDLSDNKLMVIPDGTFDQLSNLSDLDLSENSIVEVTESMFNTATRKRLDSLSLALNRFACSCQLLWFQAWLVSSPALFRTDESDYMCQNLPGTQVADFFLVEQACLLRKEMSLLIIVSCSLLLVFLTLSSLLFHYRWHLRLVFYEAFRGRNDVRRRHMEARNFDYDVFVSYASGDLQWVRNHLMGELEDRLGLKLCVHERDFIVGNNIVDNIVNCVASSKKVLMVFSRHFVASQWCQFELMFCLRHVMDYGDALIVVCVDDVLSDDVTAAMMAVLKTTTYLQWTEQDDAANSFRGRLHIALHEVVGDAELAV